VSHPGEEHTYVLEGQVILHTEFYDPLVLNVGESVYIDSNMGHAYLAGDGCKEAVVLSVCSSADESLMESLLGLHDQPAKNHAGGAVASGKAHHGKRR
jgi:quercetin dioxygenase-like cupin family protein